jgi:hypothetical protein
MSMSAVCNLNGWLDFRCLSSFLSLLVLFVHHERRTFMFYCNGRGVANIQPTPLISEEDEHLRKLGFSPTAAGRL